MEAFIKGIYEFNKMRTELRMSTNQLQGMNVEGGGFGPQIQRSPSKPVLLTRYNTNAQIMVEVGIMTEEDWNVLVGGSKTKVFKKDEVITFGGQSQVTL